MGKTRLSERLRKVGLKKKEAVGQDGSIESLGSIYLSTTLKQRREIKEEEISTEMQHKAETKGKGQRAVEVLGEAIRKKQQLGGVL